MSELGEDPQPNAWSDCREPTSLLTTPEIPERPQPIHAIDLISPAAWINEFIFCVTGHDVLASAKEAFAGDWQAYERCAVAFANLGMATEAIGSNIYHGNTVTDLMWQGNAADQAFAYFSSLSARLQHHREPMIALHDQYRAIADTVYQGAETTATLIKLIVDRALFAGISVAAGVVSGGAAPIGYALAAVAMADILDTWRLVRREIGAVEATIQATMPSLIGMVSNTPDAGIVADWQRATGDVAPLPELPERGYEHPLPIEGGR